MADDGWTEQIYGEELAAFETRLQLFLDEGKGAEKNLLKEAEELLAMRERYPAVFERHAHVEGRVADLIARHDQAEAFGQMQPRGGQGGSGDSEAPGCLLGWLFKGKR